MDLQLELEILNFSEGLRVIGANPDEKLALFADNSCRWLVADQGKHPFILSSTLLPRYYVIPASENEYFSLKFERAHF